MRIPIESLPFYLGESDNRPNAEGTRTEPVDGSAGLRSTLSYTFAEQTQTTYGDATLSRKNSESPKPVRNRKGYLTHYGNSEGQEERRRCERRQQNLPVLLDTRGHRRRKGESASCISFKV